MPRVRNASVRVWIAMGMVVTLCGSFVSGADMDGRRYVAGQVLVHWRAHAGQRAGVTVVNTDRDVLAVCEELKKDPAVAWVQPNYQYRPCRQPNDPDFPDQYAHQLIEMAQAWEISTGSHDVVLAILGTGIEIDHPDLKDNIWANREEMPNNHTDDDGNGYVDDVHGWNFEHGNSDVTPDPFSSEFFSHETQVAGVIGAVGDNEMGVAGVNWQCSMMVLRLSSNFTSMEISGALKYAADNGAQVVNMSFGGSGLGPNDDQAVKDAVEYAADRGLLLVASAGNSDTGTPHYPAAYPQVMAVSSTDGEDMKTGHSSYGPWVDIAAPGTDIMTTDVNGRYIATAGTSFSAPYVAAVGALVWSHRPELTAAQVRAVLENTADQVVYDRVDPHDGYLGVGRVNAHRALLAADQTLPLGEIVAPAPWQTLADGAETLVVTLLVEGAAYDLSIRPYGDPAWTVISQGGGGGLRFNEPVSLAVDMLPRGAYEMRLTVTSNGTTHEDSVVFAVGQQQHQAGWPRFIASGNYIEETYYYSPLCQDITGDGQNEILQASLSWSNYSPEHRINLWDQHGNDRPGWPVALDTYDPPVCRVGDIDGDGDLEVVAVFYYDNIVCAWHAESGELVDGDWPLLVSTSWVYSISGPPVLANLDGDGDSEILVGMDGTDATSDGLYALQGDGSFLWQRRYSVKGPMAVADLDQDGDVEIALCGFGPGISRIHSYVMDHNGQMIKKWRGGDVKGVVITDVDSDGLGDVVFCTEDSVQAVGLDGTTIWSTPLDAPIHSTGALSVGDLDSDGMPGIFMSTRVFDDAYTYSLLYAFDHTGKIMSDQGFPKILMGDAWECEPLVVDIDHDGHKELVAGAAGLPFMAWEADGSVTPGFPVLSLAGDYWCTPAINDLDQDGDMEFIVPGYDWRFYVVDMDVPYDPGSLDWGMVRHDSQGSGWFSPALTWAQMDVPDHVRVGDTLVISLENVSDTSSMWFTVGDLPQGAVYDANSLTILWKPTMDQAFETFDIHVTKTNGIQQINRVFQVTVQMDVLYFASMDADPGWQLDTGWAWGLPLGLGSWGGDPASAFSGTSVLGFALSGDYANDLDVPRYAQVGPINCAGHGNVILSFQRWLGLEAPYDQASIQVSNDAVLWTDLWTSGQAHIADQTWQHVAYAVPDAVARDQAAVYFRWGLGPTDNTVTFPGWNLDDIMVSGDEITE